MEMQKTVNLLNSFENEFSNFLQKENGTLLTVNQRVTICTKAQSNFEQVH